MQEFQRRVHRRQADIVAAAGKDVPLLADSAIAERGRKINGANGIARIATSRPGITGDGNNSASLRMVEQTLCASPRVTSALTAP